MALSVRLVSKASGLAISSGYEGAGELFDQTKPNNRTHQTTTKSYTNNIFLKTQLLHILRTNIL